MEANPIGKDLREAYRANANFDEGRVIVSSNSEVNANFIELVTEEALSKAGLDPSVTGLSGSSLAGAISGGKLDITKLGKTLASLETGGTFTKAASAFVPGAKVSVSSNGWGRRMGHPDGQNETTLDLGFTPASKWENLKGFVLVLCGVEGAITRADRDMVRDLVERGRPESWDLKYDIGIVYEKLRENDRKACSAAYANPASATGTTSTPTNVNSQETDEIKEIFNRFDTDGSG